jgi:hypothetical protein
MDARSQRIAHSPRRARLVLAVAAVAATAACLFETTPPKARPGTMQPPPEDEAVVTGLVQTRNRVNGNIAIAPGWTMLVNWYRTDHNGDGQPDIVGGGVVTANSSGVYEARYRGADLIRVAIAGRLCTIPEAPDCCLQEPPCNHPDCIALWGPQRTLAVTPGASVQQNMTVSCP